jgi:hypothetical protein
MQYTLGEAARATGKSKAAISRAIKNHTMSAQKLENGSYKIDAAELHRVYPPVAVDGTVTGEMERIDTQHDTGMLQGKVEVLIELVAQLQSERDDLRRRLDSEGEERRRTQAQLTALLTDRREKARETTPEAPARRKWLSWR